MAETVVAFQSQLSVVMEAVFKAAMFEVTRLVEEIFLVEVKHCREQVGSLKRRLKLAESKRKRREATDNQGCRNCGGSNDGQPQVSNEKAVDVQTEISVKQEQERLEEMNCPQEVKYEINSSVASPSSCPQSKQQNSSDIMKMSNVVKMENSDDELFDGPSSQVIEPEFQSSWETQFDQKSTYQKDNDKSSPEPLCENQYDNMDHLNNTSHGDANISGTAAAADDDDDDDLVYMGQCDEHFISPTTDEQQTCQTDQSRSKAAPDIDSLLIKEEGYLQDPDTICSDVDSDQNFREGLNLGANMSSDRAEDLLGEPNTITDISHMIEMLEQQSIENGLHTCNLCLATFHDAASLKAHKQTHKEPEKGLPYLYNQRRKTFSRSCNLKSEGPHLCSKCGRAFPSLFKLQKHKCDQVGGKPFCCAVCGNKFSRLWNLKLHRRIHTQEKPHHCTMCDKSFTRADILKVHQRTHTGECPYCCLVCGLKFKRLDHLKSHQRKHISN